MLTGGVGVLSSVVTTAPRTVSAPLTPPFLSVA